MAEWTKAAHAETRREVERLKPPRRVVMPGVALGRVELAAELDAARRDAERLTRERDEIRATRDGWHEKIAAERDAALARAERLERLLRILDSRGGLGHDVHAEIATALATADKESK